MSVSVKILSVLTVVAYATGQLPSQELTDQCLGCICEAISNCDTTLGCQGDVCGLLKITWPYWADANKPTLKFDSAEDPGAFSRCVTDPECAKRAVAGYMAKFAQDCNGDGVINCYDYAAIHRLGGYGCKSPADPSYWNKFTNCQAQVNQLQPQG